jgi:signal transduction histidine kinase
MESFIVDRTHDDQERVARDLHDVLIPRLSRLSFELAAISQLVGEAAAERCLAAIEDVDGIIDITREISFDLLGGGTAERATSAMIREVAEDAQRRIEGSGLVAVDGGVDGLPQATRQHLLAVVRVAVENVVQHAQASQLDVLVRVTDDTLRLCVSDDGVGVSGPVQGLGIGSMAARAHTLGGTFTVTSAPARGTAVLWSVPLRREREE